LETSLFRQSLALVLTTQNKHEKIQQNINKLALGKKNTQNQQSLVASTPVRTAHYVCAYNCVQLWYTIQH